MTLPKGLRGYLPPPDEPAVPVHVFTDKLGDRVSLTSNSPNQWIAASGMMLRVLVGSTVHGTAVDGQDDEDQMGVCVEPPQYVIGMKRFSHYEFRTAVAREGKRTDGSAPCSGPGDLDLIVYSLRRYVHLAAAGNPTVLLPLFVPDNAVFYQNEYGQELREGRSMFLSKQCAARFKGYLHSQREGLMGLRSGGTRNQGRADIRAKYGYDVKFAMHMLRLGMQGVELLETGNITLPMDGQRLKTLRAVRRGEYAKDWTLEQAERYEERIDSLTATTKLPDEPDWQRINSWLIDVHRRYWGFA